MRCVLLQFQRGGVYYFIEELEQVRECVNQVGFPPVDG